jgi:hypothetical protein
MKFRMPGPLLPPADNQPRRKKYHATPTIYKGVRYPSKMQAARAIVLDDMYENGEIDWWLREVAFDLGEDTRYRADFVVATPSGVGVNLVRVHAEDTKGKVTSAFRKIMKLWRKYGPMPLHVIQGKHIEIIEGREDE